MSGVEATNSSRNLFKKL